MLIRLLLIFSISLFSVKRISAQTTLAAGDILFTSYNAVPGAGTAPDTFTFVVLTPIAVNTVIYFTDRGYHGGTTWQASGGTEGTISWTVGSALSIGNEVEIVGYTARVNSISNGTVAQVAGGNVTTGLSLGNTGDQLIAFQGASGNPTSVSAVFICGMSWQFNCGTVTDATWNGSGCTYGPQSSQMPPGLTGGTNAFLTSTTAAFSSGYTSHGRYECNGAPFANVAAIKTALMNRNNWDFSDNTISSDIVVPAGCTFLSTATTWNGSTWSNGNPTNTVDAIIASNTAPSSFASKNLTINSGVSLTTTGITATVNGNIVNNGNGIAGTGGLTIAANSTISGTAFSFNGVLTVNTGATLTTGGLLTLSSNATNTARVANSAGAIDGTVAVQRYIPGKRAYRFLTAPLSSNGLTAVNVSNSWQTQTHVVGPTGTGLDAVKPMYSMLTYSSGAWQNVTNTTTTTLFNNTTTASNKAFALFVTGDRTINLSSTSQFNNSTLSATGKLLQGNQSFALGSQTANSFHFIGNPYASPVDLNQMFLNAGTSNINRTFYTWDPNLSTTGGYVTISWNGSSYTITPGAGTSQTQIIQSGQAFFVQATNTNTTTVVFEENDKSTTTINNVFGVGNGNTDNLNINLQRIENGSLSTRDGVTASFGAAFNKAIVATEDADKLFNNEEGITIKRGTTNLSIERRPYITNTNDTIFLGLNRLVPNTNYTLNLNAQGWDAGMQAVLVDNLLSTETLINLQSANQDLNISSTIANEDNRWMIVFRGTGNLPSNKLSIIATKRDKDVQLTWNIANEIGVKEYELQRSVDGTNFQAINNQVASNKGEYSNLDTKANNGVNYYRVKMTMLNDDTRYSNTIAFNIQHSSSNIISIYPNPIKGNVAQIQLNDLAAGDYTIRLIDMNGKVLQNNILKNLSGTSNRIIDLSNIATGIYQLKLEGKNLSSVVSLVKSN